MNKELIQNFDKGTVFNILSPNSEYIKLPIATGQYEIIQTEVHDRGRSTELFFFKVETQRTDSKIYSCRNSVLEEVDKLGLLTIHTPSH